MEEQEILQEKITIRAIRLFPYEINQRDGNYLFTEISAEKKEVKIVDKAILENHYCVAYEGKNARLVGWARRHQKRLRNLAPYFEGMGAEQKRQIAWAKMQSNSLEPRVIEFAERFRKEPLFIWYLSRHDLPIAQFIQRFLEYYWLKNPEVKQLTILDLDSD